MQLNKKAVALISGGLDSTLAAIIIARQGIEVFGVQFLTPFGCNIEYEGHCVHDVNSVAAKFGFHIKLCPVGTEYIRMVENPKFGYGKNLNPCVDCRVFMLNWAKEYSKEVGASFLVTGEVLNQRPLSQRRFRFIEIDKEVGMEGLILRPLSAKLLPPTLPEKYGIVDREKLYSICGRSRKVQLKLAKEFGLEEIAQPAGGCLLTSPEFSARLKALFSIKKFNTPKDIQLLKIGRHFKISPNALFIVARDEKECEILEEEFKDCGIIIKSNGKGPIGLLYNSKEESDILTASKILSVYTKKVTPTEECKFYADGIVITLSEKPSFDFIEQFRVTATI